MQYKIDPQFVEETNQEDVLRPFSKPRRAKKYI